jgi:hypothetical protein
LLKTVISGITFIAFSFTCFSLCSDAKEENELIMRHRPVHGVYVHKRNTSAVKRVEFFGKAMSCLTLRDQ